MGERGLEASLRVRRTELISGAVSVGNGRKLILAWLPFSPPDHLRAGRVAL